MLGASDQVESSGPFTARWALPLFGIALVLNFVLSTFRWEQGYMPGHEFRQAQTVLIAYYIDKDSNFGLDYETPVLGKPWAFPLEYPLYQWTVVGVHRATDWDLIQSARFVSLACFYMGLPAVWIAMGALGAGRSLRWLVLALILVCPVHIYYSRAALIDPLALALSIWFLAAFLCSMQSRRWSWWGLATVTASAAVLVKGLVFVVWVLPAAVFGAKELWSGWRAKQAPSEVLRTFIWGVGMMVLPFVCAKWWVGYTDAIKATHSSAWVFTSEALAWDNYGTFSVSSRLSWQTWETMSDRWSEALIYPWLLSGFVMAGLLVGKGYRWGICGALLAWLSGQLIIPYAYAYQDYYFYAGAVFLCLAFGLIIAAVWQTLRKWVVVRWLGLSLPILGMLGTYFNGYFLQQKVISPGGSSMTQALRDFLPPDSVLMVLGQDWAAITPYRAERRALMVRNGLEHDWDYLIGATRDLEDEDLNTLIVSGDLRTKRDLIRFLTDRIGLVASPAFRFGDSDVYLDPTIYADIRKKIGSDMIRYRGIKIVDEQAGQGSVNRHSYLVTPGRSARAFPSISPGVIRFRSEHGYSQVDLDGTQGINAHPLAELEIHPTSRSGRVSWSYGLNDMAWDRDGPASDGVGFAVYAVGAEGERRELHRRDVNPVDHPTDRGVQTSEFAFDIGEGETLLFVTEPLGHPAFDWAFLTSIVVSSP